VAAYGDEGLIYRCVDGKLHCDELFSFPLLFVCLCFFFVFSLLSVRMNSQLQIPRQPEGRIAVVSALGQNPKENRECMPRLSFWFFFWALPLA
jgi:hypothetical protein